MDNIHARVDRVEQGQLTLASELHQSNKLLTRIDERLSNMGEKLSDVVKVLREDISEVREDGRLLNKRLEAVELHVVETRTTSKVFRWFLTAGATGGFISLPMWVKQGLAMLVTATK